MATDPASPEPAASIGLGRREEPIESPSAKPGEPAAVEEVLIDTPIEMPAEGGQALREERTEAGPELTKKLLENHSGERTGAPSAEPNIGEADQVPQQATPRIVEVSIDDTEWGLKSSVWQGIERAVSNSPSAEQVRDLVSDWQLVLQNKRLPKLRFSDNGASLPSRFIAVPEGESVEGLWFIGDVHGDILGLQTAIAYIHKQDAEATICFLGDLFDRGFEHGWVLFRFLQLLNCTLGKVAFVVGNHDEGLLYDSDTHRFASSVSPSEASDWLNEQPMDSPWRELAQIAIWFFRRAPRAILLPDGLLVAHGGVPHVDLHGRLNSRDDLESADFLEDFVWTRLHETVKKRIPNRSTRGCSLGVEDFDKFCSRLEATLGRPVRGIIRGHDHLEARFAHFSQYRKHSVLTINTMCHRLNSEIPGSFDMPLIVAKYEARAMPTIHRLRVPRHLLDGVYSSATDADQRKGSTHESN